MKKLTVILMLLALLLAGCGKETTDSEPTPAPLLLEGQSVEKGAKTLSLQGTATMEELRTVLQACPELRELHFESCDYTPSERRALLTDYPKLRFDWPLRYGDIELRSTDARLDLSAARLDVSALAEVLSQCCGLETVELGEKSLTLPEAEALHEANSAVLIRYDTELFGQTLSTDSEEIDLSGTVLESTEELEREIVRFPKLRKAVMVDCGLDNETMDGLNRKYEDIRFVWMVQVYNRGIRTDQDYFILYNCEKQYPGSNGSCLNLRYCTDLVAADLGHCFIREEELQFLYSTPHMKYLVVIDGLYNDISPIGSLKELEYLEMFSSQVDDLTPLLDCPQLKHLNISRCNKLGAECIDVLCQMKQLERLWFIGTYLSPDFGETLEAALGDTEIHYVPYTNGLAPYSMDFNWRRHESYYAMRDALHMYYMDNQM